MIETMPPLRQLMIASRSANGRSLSWRSACFTRSYAYVGPFDRSAVSGAYWNAPFGAVRTRSGLDAAGADEFIAEGLGLLGR